MSLRAADSEAFRSVVGRTHPQDIVSIFAGDSTDEGGALSEAVSFLAIAHNQIRHLIGGPCAENLHPLQVVRLSAGRLHPPAQVLPRNGKHPLRVTLQLPHHKLVQPELLISRPVR